MIDEVYSSIGDFFCTKKIYFKKWSDLKCIEKNSQNQHYLV